MDLLADALRVSGARGSLGTRVEAGGRWGLWLDTFPGLALHAVTAGNLWLTVPGARPRKMEAGDAVLLAEGTEHGLASEPGVMMGPCDRERAARTRAIGGVLRLGSQPMRTTLVTLHYEQDLAVRTPVLTALEGAVQVVGGERSYLHDTVGLLTRTDDTVEAVAAAVGYSSPHAFSRAFRRARGLSPSEFRTNARAVGRISRRIPA